MADGFPDKVHLRYCLLYKFKRGSNATVAAKNLSDTNGNKALSVSQCQRYFARFRSGDYSLEELPKSGRPLEEDNDLLRTLVESNPRQTTNGRKSSIIMAII